MVSLNSTTRIMNRLIFVMFPFFLVGCYKKKYEQSQQENSELLTKVESLEGNLYAEKSAFEAQANAYKTLEESYFKITTQLVEINREFNLIEQRDEEIKGFERELTEFVTTDKQNEPLAIQVKNNLAGVVNANKNSIEKNKALLNEIENLTIDNKALQDAIQLFKTEIVFKEKLNSNSRQQIGNLEQTIKRLNNKLDLQKTSCEELLAKKDKEIYTINTELGNIRIEYDVCKNSINEYLGDIRELNEKVTKTSIETIKLTNIVLLLNSSIDSLNRLHTDIPDCALAYYIIDSKSNLIKNGFLIEKRRGYEINEELLKSRGNKLNFYFTNEIILPNTMSNFEIIHSKSKKGFSIRNQKLIINDKDVFTEDKFLVIGY